MQNNTFILLSRSITESAVFANEKWLKVWVWLLVKANHKKAFVPLRVGKGVTTVEVQRGQFIFGRNKAADELFIDPNTLYKIIQKLVELEQITVESNNQYSIITICNYDTYQSSEGYEVTTKQQPSNNEVTAKQQPSNNEVTAGQQPSNSQVTAGQQPSNTNNNDNNKKNDKNVNNDNNPSDNTGAAAKAAEPKGSVLTKSEEKFLTVFNRVAGRNFKTLDDKTKERFKKLVKKGHNAEDFERAITNCLNDSKNWPNPNHLTPEYITREHNFLKYLADQQPLNNKPSHATGNTANQPNYKQPANETTADRRARYGATV